MLDVEFCRGQFPSFSTEPACEWAFFENAGGSYVPAQVSDWLHRCFTDYKVQPYASSEMAIRMGQDMDMAHHRMAELFNAAEDEITFGPSTTMNVYVLAQAFRSILGTGDEVVVTNQDHEANIGAWRRLPESGIKVLQWDIDPVSGELDPENLRRLISGNTRLVCFSLCSNIVGTMNDVRTVCEIAHDAGALVVADGVSYAPHRVMDVSELGVDFALFSTYKTFGTHQGIMWGSRSALAQLPGQSHEFNEQAPRYRMNPTGPQHAQIAALNGMFDYYDAVYDRHFEQAEPSRIARAKKVFGLFAEHETSLADRLLDFLRDNPAIRLIGQNRATAGNRAATISFVTLKKGVGDVNEYLAARRIGVGCGNFYALRCVEALGIPADPGVLRVSMVHYNTEKEVDRLISALDEAI